MSRVRTAMAMVAVLPSLASAAQWTVVPQLALTADTDTNRRLQQPPRPSDGAVVGGVLAITRLTEVSTFALTPRGSVSRYSGDDVLDSEDWGVNTMYRHSGERLSFDVQAGIADDSTLTTELGETGFVEGNTRRHSRQASTSLSQYLGSRHLLRYQLAMSDIDYDRTLGTGLVGYRYPSIDLLYTANMSPRVDVTVMANVARLEVPLTHVETDTRGAQIGFRFRVSERFDLEARAGRTNTQARGRSDVAQSYLRERIVARRTIESFGDSVAGCGAERQRHPGACPRSSAGVFVQAHRAPDAGYQCARQSSRGYGRRPAPLCLPLWRRVAGAVMEARRKLDARSRRQLRAPGLRNSSHRRRWASLRTQRRMAASTMNTEEKEGASLTDLVDVVRRRARAIAITFAIAFLVTCVLALALPSTYRSTGTILIEQQEIPTDLVRSTVTSYADERVQIISQRVMTTQNLLDIIRRYDLYQSLQKRESRENVIDRMRDDIQFRMISADVVDPRTGVPRRATIAFTVSYDSPSPDLAVKVANEITSLYLNENLSSRNRLAEDASSFLTTEGDRLSKHIAELEARLAEFKERNIGQLPELVQLNMQLLDRTEQQLRDAVTEQRSYAQQKVYLEAQLAQLKPNSVMFSDAGDRILTPSDRLRALKSELASSRALYAGDHPDIARLTREIAGLEQQGEAMADDNDLLRQLDAARAELGAARERYSPEHPDVKNAERTVAALEAELGKPRAAAQAAPCRAARQPGIYPDPGAAGFDRQRSAGTRRQDRFIARTGRQLPEESRDDARWWSANIASSRATTRTPRHATRKCAPSRRRRSSRRTSKPIARASASR